MEITQPRAETFSDPGGSFAARLADPASLQAVEIASGKRFKIEEYDGSEYIITEDDLDMVAP